MKKEVRRSILSGKVDAPASAAMAHRAIMIATLVPGQTIVSNVPNTPDVAATIGACRAFGADILFERSIADVFGPEDLVAPPVIDCKESNTTLKLFLPFASLFDTEITFIGSGRLEGSKVTPYADYLGGLSVLAHAEKKSLPLKIKGPMEQDGFIYFPFLGSQFLSGLLLAIPCLEEETAIEITGKMSGAQYVEGTVEMMKKSGIEFVTAEPEFYDILAPQPYLSPDEIVVPGSAHLSSFMLLAGAIAGKAEIGGIMRSQEIEALFNAFSASVKFEEGKMSSSIGVLESADLQAPDIKEYIPHALVLASIATGETKIANIKGLGMREENRARLMMRELIRMGADISEKEGAFVIKGGKLAGAEIQPDGDPKVAMAASVAALGARGPSIINGAECVDKAYPGFFSDLSKLGAIIR